LRWGGKGEWVVWRDASWSVPLMWIELFRCFAPTSLVLLGGLGLWQQGAWLGLGLAGLVVLGIADCLAPKDGTCHTTLPRWMTSLALYLPLPAIVLLWYLLARQLAMNNTAMGEDLVALITAAFLTTLGALPAAHELSHRKTSLSQWYTRLYSAVLGLPLYDIHHVHRHHIDVATVKDIDTPQRGQTLYGFVYPSLFRAVQAAITIEKERLANLGHGPWWWRGRIVEAFAWLLVWFGFFVAVAGLRGVPYFFAIWLLAWMIFGGFNYTQHYGLIRVPGQPIEVRHSWNHLNRFSRAITFEIANHSEHHLDPDKPYPALSPLLLAPQMPSIMLCFALAFIPPLWEKWIARPRLMVWDSLASSEEQILARKANTCAGWR